MLISFLFLSFILSALATISDYCYLRANHPKISDAIRATSSQILVISIVLIIANIVNVDWAMLSVTIFAITFKCLDECYFKPIRQKSGNPDVDPFIEIAQDLCWFLVILMFVRAFIIQPYRVPSGSLEPTVDTGDFIMVNQFAYGLKVPILHYEFLPIGTPKRGDIALFYYPKNPKQIYVKRIIGLPGDHIIYQNKTLMINGDIINKKDQGWYQNINQLGFNENVKLYEEELLTTKHDIIIKPFTPDYGQTNLVVPKGQYFVMGDNRDDSNDSRFWGTVPESAFIGKAFLVWMSWDPHHWNVRWNRIGLQL